MAAKLTYAPIFGFLGVDRNTSPFLATEGNFAYAENLATEKGGILKKTGDYELKNAQITASRDIFGGIDFMRADGTHEHFVAQNGGSNAEIYKDVAGTWTSQAQSLTTGSKIRFAYSPTLDMLFAVNYSDATRSYNGSAWSTSTNVTSAPKGKIILPFGDRMYIFNAVVSSVAYPTRAYRSSLTSGGSITWDTTNDWIVFDDVIVGAGFNGENMIVMCENSTYIFTLSDQKYKLSDVGCVSHESIASYKTLTFWAARDGIYVTNGADVQKISFPLQELWDTISESDLSGIQGKVIGDNYVVFVNGVTVDGIAKTNMIFMWDISQSDWSILRLGITVKHLHTFVTSTGKKLFAGDNNGKVYKLFSSGAQNSSEFRSAIETDWFYGSAPKEKESFYELWGFGEKLSALKVSYKIDTAESNWTPVGELNGAIDSVKYKAKGRRIKFLLQEVSKGNLYELHRLEIGYVPYLDVGKDTES